MGKWARSDFAVFLLTNYPEIMSEQAVEHICIVCIARNWWPRLSF